MERFVREENARVSCSFYELNRGDLCVRADSSDPIVCIVSDVLLENTSKKVAICLKSGQSFDGSKYKWRRVKITQPARYQVVENE